MEEIKQVFFGRAPLLFALPKANAKKQRVGLSAISFARSSQKDAAAIPHASAELHQRVRVQNKKKLKTP